MTTAKRALLASVAAAAVGVLATLAVTGELTGANDRRLAEARELARHNYDAWSDTDAKLKAAEAELAALPAIAAPGPIEACNITTWKVTPAEYGCLKRHRYTFPHGVWTNGFGEIFILENRSPEFVRRNALHLVTP